MNFYRLFLVDDILMKIKWLIPVVFVLLMWVVFIVQLVLNLDVSSLGIYPKDSTTLLGIFTSPLIHGNWNHLISNTLPVLILGMILFVMYEKMALTVWILNYILTGLLVWLFARSSYHIGASGIVYGLASFLLFSGFFRMDIKAIAVASGVAIFYGGMVWGILPLKEGISWESHLFGGIVGFGLAFLFKNNAKDKIMEHHEHEPNNRKSYDDFLNT